MEDTLEWEMLCTLIKKVQKDDTLAQEEKNRRVTMLFDWWKKNDRKFIKINDRIDKLNRKNRPINFLLILKQCAFVHSLHCSYRGIEKTHSTTETYKKKINDDILFLKNLIAEIKEYHSKLQEFYK